VSCLRSLGGVGVARRRPVLLAGLERLGGMFLPRDVRGMVLKDLRTVLRDPAQWSQALIFFGLLALYFSNIRSFYTSRLPADWRNLVAFLNVFSVASVQCSLASRFIYPQLSLEGQAFWVLGLSPTRMGRILAVKFWMALAGMLTVSVGLMLISTSMLDVAPVVRLTAVGLAAAISIAVSGFSTGLGAVFLDLKSSNPMAAVSGFGGTVNLVLSLGFMLAVILPAGLVFQLAGSGRISPAGLARGLAAVGCWTVLATGAAAAVPLRLGRRALEQRDY
jgi:ABC-2 type transport system permease protein